jgi:hypothetical protein
MKHYAEQYDLMSINNKRIIIHQFPRLIPMSDRRRDMNEGEGIFYHTFYYIFWNYCNSYLTD